MQFNAMKHIKLFETWQGFTSKEESKDRDYTTTVDELLSWAAGQDWKEDLENLIDLLMVDGDFPTNTELIGYHEMLKRRADSTIEVYSQELDGQVLSDWVLDGVEFSLVSWDWPLTSGEILDEAEEEAYFRLVAQLEPEFEAIGANRADLMDFIQWASGRGDSPRDLSVVGFKNWFAMRRSGAN
jgi:hypothetical protein